MENDDKPVGQILSRRDAIKVLGIGTAAFLTACTSPEETATFIPTEALTQVASTETAATVGTVLDCVVRPELTIGPYFVDEQLERSDIRANSADNTLKEGVPLTLNINVASVSENSCTPIEGAQVDIWHCDALGEYSGVSAQGSDTTGQDFLRGFQRTDANGAVQFQTIYPGWYSGRAVHIHFTIRTQGAGGESYQFTSQFFFDDALTDQVHALEPYASKGQRNIRNSDDNILSGGGDQLLLNLQGDTANGYSGSMSIGLDLADTGTGASDINSGGPPP